MNTDHEIVIILSTFNRAEILRVTLESMTRLDTAGLDWALVAVDNNSSDDTRAVIESFAGRLPIRYLFEPRPGKNCALNKALNESQLGQIVVFTDDDITPEKDWLQAIRQSVSTYPEIACFGGKINPMWPQDPPAWANNREIKEIGFGDHDRGESPGFYQDFDFPIGANFWVRREVLAHNRFNEAVGPRPRNRIMGSETSFLRMLRDQGVAMLHIPAAAVGHRLDPEQVDIGKVWQRAYRSGRGVAHCRAPYNPERLRRSPRFWRFCRWLALGQAAAQLAWAYAVPSAQRVGRVFVAVRWLGYAVEVLRVSRDPHWKPKLLSGVSQRNASASRFRPAGAGQTAAAQPRAGEG